MSKREESFPWITFFTLFRKRGVPISLSILSRAPDKEIRQTDFFNILKKEKGELNSFFRVRKSLLEHKLIAYKLNDKYEKVIYLTEKGRKIVDYLTRIESLLKYGDKDQ